MSGELSAERDETPQEQIVPVVGMGATVYHYSDRTACSVIQILSPTKIVLREDRAERTDKNGMSESQSYKYFPDEKGKLFIVKKGKKTGWHVESDGRSKTLVGLGQRRKYHDFSF